MDKKLAGLLGAVAGLATIGSAQAATGPSANSSEALQASSYADLLAPVANAKEALKADDEARAREAAKVELAQYYYYYGPPFYFYHHHHHHHHHWRRYHHHHHHHHHHHWWGY